MYKDWTSVVILLLLFVVASVHSDESSYSDCLHPGANPFLYYYQEISKSGYFLQYQEETIRIPETGFSPKPITCVTVVNLLSDEKGGYPYVKDGGVGYNYVIMYFKSQWSLGFDFRVSVYYDDSVGDILVKSSAKTTESLPTTPSINFCC